MGHDASLGAANRSEDRARYRPAGWRVSASGVLGRSRATPDRALREDDMAAEDTRKVAELLKGQRFGFLTTRTPEGKLTSRPMALQEVEFDGDLWFFAEQSAPWLGHISHSSQVNVGAGSGGSWVSLTGEAVIVSDVAKKKRSEERRVGKECRSRWSPYP